MSKQLRNKVEMYPDQLVLESNPSSVKKKYVKNMFHMVACIGVRRKKTSAMGKLRSGEPWDLFLPSLALLPQSSWVNELVHHLTTGCYRLLLLPTYFYLSFGSLSIDFKCKCLPFLALSSHLGGRSAEVSCK